MAEFKIGSRMIVKTLKRNFKKEFGATLRVYNGARFADDDATLASIKAPGSKGGEVVIGGNTLVGNFEKKMKENFGINVQVAVADDSKLASNSITLCQAGK